MIAVKIPTQLRTCLLNSTFNYVPCCDATAPPPPFQDERFGAVPARRCSPEGSAQSQLALTRQVGGTVMELLVQLCGGDGGAVVVGMMAQAFPAGMCVLPRSFYSIP